MSIESSKGTRLKQFNWGPGIFLIIYHLLLLIGVPSYLIFFDAPWGMIFVSAILMYITGLSITMGYHRLYAHTSYKMNSVAEAILLFFGTMATQGSALRWSFDHRHHHAFVDTDQDPYSISKGFWYAHFLWLFEKPKEIDPKVVSDLMRKPLLVFQHRFYSLLMFGTNLLAFLSIGWIFDNYLGAFVFGCLMRMFVLHHLTWFINSLAHTWGARTFCKELSAVDNYIIALLTFGEGYHNYHHTFAYDYRNGIRWFHFDPTKWLIWILSKCGLAKQLRRVQTLQIEERLLSEHKEILLKKIQDSLSLYKEEWETKISHIIENVLTKSKQVKKMKDIYYDLKKKNGEKEHLIALKKEIKAVKRSLHEEYRSWKALVRTLQASATSSEMDKAF